MKANEEQVKGLLNDRQIREEEENLRAARDATKIDELLKKSQRLENLIRESTRELLEKKKQYLGYERRIKEERAHLLEESKMLKTEIANEKARNENMERVIETRIKRKQDGIVQDLKTKLSKYESELRTSKVHILFKSR